MHSNQFHRTRVAAAIAGVVLALGAGQAFGAAFALRRRAAAASAMRMPAAPRSPKTRARCGAIRPACRGSRRSRSSVAGNIVTPSIKFRNDGSLPRIQSAAGRQRRRSRRLRAIPAMYVVVPINQQFAFGLGVNAPFGLETDWDNGWLGRYQGLNSKVETINVNPALSWKIEPQLHRRRRRQLAERQATLTGAHNYSAALLQGAQQAAAQCAPARRRVMRGHGRARREREVTATTTRGAGTSALMWDINPDTRIGAHYRSSIKYNVSGNVDIDNPTLAAAGKARSPPSSAIAAGAAAQRAYDGGVTPAIEVPATATCRSSATSTRSGT